MDGFDDLLSSSRAALEDNPFANPFGNARSGSPDPWASFGQQQHEESPFAEAGGFNNAEGFGGVAAGSEHESTGGVDALKNDFELDDEESSKEKSPQHTPADSGPPLQLEEDSEPVTPVDTDYKTPLPKSPGFRESLDTDGVEGSKAGPSKEDRTPTPSLEPTRGPTPISSLGPQSPPLSPLPQVQEQSTTTSVNASQPTSPAASTFSQSASASAQKGIVNSNKVISPLDYPSPSFTQSFASLALGGESIGGWQDSTSAFGSTSISSEAEPSVPGDNEERKDEEEETSASNVKADNALQPLFTIAVDDPEKVGDPIRPYILYTVKTRTSSPLYSKSQFSVLRRYSDFLWLYETLAQNNPGVFVPPVPEKSSFGRFDGQFIQQRRAALQKCIVKIANHPVLARDPDLKLFLESDTFSLDIKHRKTEIAQERGGLMSSIGQAVAGPRFYEMDDWFDKKRVYLDSLESQLKGMVKAIEIVSKQRSEMAAGLGEFALAIGDLSGSDLGQPLSHAFAVLSDVEKKAQDLQNEQAHEDIESLMSTAEEYVRIIGSVRLAFSSRIRCHALWQSAEGELRRVKQVHEKARSQGKIPQDRIGHSFAQIADAEKKALDAKQEFEKCSKLVKNEMSRFEEERVRDIKDSLEVFLEGMIERQKQLIAAWENYQNVLLKKANITQRQVLMNTESAVA